MTEPTLELPLIPTRNQVVLPHTQAKLEVVRPKSLAALAGLDLDANPEIVVAPQRDYAVEEPAREDVHETGVRATIVGYKHYEGLGYVLEIAAAGRLSLREVCERDGALVASCEVLTSSEGRELGDTTLTTFAELCEVLNASDPEERSAVLDRIETRLQAERERMQKLDPPTGTDLQQVWVLEDGSEERIVADLAGGNITAEEADWLRQFRDKGYVVWERLIDPADIDALVRDVGDIAKHPGHFVSTDHGRSRPFRFTDSTFGSFESIFDLYVNFESARRVCFHPTITRFLTLLFDAKPLAIQQLLFQRSNQHLLHQDTAYVCVKDALLMAATWIALEDVVAGRGELTYFEGSHHLPHKLFADGSKRFQPELDDAKTTEAEHLANCEAAGHPKRDFLAKKGDVFVWAADLVHGSNKRTAPEHETRMSCVTHYCPATTEPLFFWLHPHLREIQPFGDALYSSAYYRLPVEGKVARPVFGGYEPC